MPTPRRILFVLGSLGGGGTERQVVEILRRIDRDRFTPLLYLVYRTGELLGEVPRDVPILSFGDRYVRPTVNWPGRILSQHVRHLARTIQRENVELVYDRTIHATLIASPAARQVGKPNVSVVVNDPKLDLEASGQRFVWFKRRMLRKAYQNSTRIVTVSEGVKAGLVRYYGLPPERIETIYNLFDLDKLQQRASESVRPFARDRFHVVASGRLQHQKGFATLLEAIERLVLEYKQQTVQLHIFGQGPDESSLRQFVEQHQLGDHVVFEGFKSNPLPYVRQANLFCLSSLFEGMPNSLVEAMACGVPVVSTDCPSGPAEILDGGKLGTLVPPGDPVAMALAINDAIQNYDACRGRLDAAKQRIHDRFDWRIGLRELMGTFDEILGHKPRTVS